VYQRIDARTGKPVPGRYEFTYRDATGLQVWQTARVETKADAKAERAELLARMHKGERVERTALRVSEVAAVWLERGTGQNDRWAPSTRERYRRIVRQHIDGGPELGARPIGACKLRELSMDRVPPGRPRTSARSLRPRRGSSDQARTGLPLRRPPRLAQ